MKWPLLTMCHVTRWYNLWDDNTYVSIFMKYTYIIYIYDVISNIINMLGVLLNVFYLMPLSVSLVLTFKMYVTYQLQITRPWVLYCSSFCLFYPTYTNFQIRFLFSANFTQISLNTRSWFIWDNNVKGYFYSTISLSTTFMNIVW